MGNLSIELLHELRKRDKALGGLFHLALVVSFDVADSLRSVARVDNTFRVDLEFAVLLGRVVVGVLRCRIGRTSLVIEDHNLLEQ